MKPIYKDLGSHVIKVELLDPNSSPELSSSYYFTIRVFDNNTAIPNIIIPTEPEPAKA